MQFASPAQRPWLYGLLALVVAANFSGILVTLFGVDAPLYASIAKQMAISNNYIELFCYGNDWLDKPHFPFWVSALSFEVFGFTTWAYKLPGILFMLMGARYTYLLGKKLYNEEIGYWATIILLTAEHILLSNNDVRAEPYLTGLIIAAIYHFYRSYTSKEWYHLWLGALFTGCAVMTKGPFAVFPIGAAIGGELLFKKNWKELFNARWLLAAVLIIVFILPELLCLWYQFDMHPEKVIFGRTNVSGIKFFFWDSQFGRFMNTGPIKGKGDLSFFLHTLLWAFLPWSIVLYMALVRMLGKKWKLTSSYKEWLTYSGALATLLLFSLSKFQLPHYSNIIFPLLAIIVAGYLLQVEKEKEVKAISIIQLVLISILVIAPIGLTIWLQLNIPVLAMIAMALLLLLIIMLPRLIRFNKIHSWMIRSVLAIVFANIFINTAFYPELFRYQSGSEAAKWVNTNQPGVPVVQHTRNYSFPLEFYLNAPIVPVDDNGEYFVSGPYLAYLPKKDLMPGTKAIAEFPYYPIAKLKAKFLNPSTRAQLLDTFVLVRVDSVDHGR